MQYSRKNSRMADRAVRPVSVRTKARKLGKNALAVLLAASMVSWQTPVYALADENVAGGGSSQSDITLLQAAGSEDPAAQSIDELIAAAELEATAEAPAAPELSADLQAESEEEAAVDASEELAEPATPAESEAPEAEAQATEATDEEPGAEPESADDTTDAPEAIELAPASAPEEAVSIDDPQPEEEATAPASSRKAAPRKVAESGIVSSNDLSDFPIAVAIVDKDGGKPEYQDGAAVVHRGQTYTIVLDFNEISNGLQFDMDKLNFDMKEAVAAGLVLENQVIYVNVEFSNNGVSYAIENNPCTIREDGHLLFQWNINDDDFELFKDMGNTQVQIKFDAQFAENASEIPFGEKTLPVIFDEGSDLKISKGLDDSQYGKGFDPGNMTADYKIEVKSIHTNAGIKISDYLKSDKSALSIKPETIKVYYSSGSGEDELLVEGDDYQLVESSNSGFEVEMIRELKNNELVIVRYTADVDPSKLSFEERDTSDYGKALVSKGEEGMNAAVAVSDTASQTDPAEYELTDVVLDSVDKTRGDVKYADDALTAVIPWTINITSNPHMTSVRDATIGDRLSPENTSIIKYSGEGITVTRQKISNENGWTETSTDYGFISWAELGINPDEDSEFTDISMNTFRELFSEEEQSPYYYKYTLKYDTEVTLTNLSGEDKVENYAISNDSDVVLEDSREWGIGAPRLTKDVNDGHEDMTWNVGVEIPAAGYYSTNAVYVEDTLPNWQYFNDTWTTTVLHDELIGGLAGIQVVYSEQAQNERYEVKLLEGDTEVDEAAGHDITGFRVYFYYTDDNGVTRNGLSSTGNSRNVTITYTTKNNELAQAYADGEEETPSGFAAGIEWEKHKNVVNLSGIKPSETEAVGVTKTHEMSKQGIPWGEFEVREEVTQHFDWDPNYTYIEWVGTGAILPYYAYSIVLRGLEEEDLAADGSLVIEDSFDGNYLKLFRTSEENDNNSDGKVLLWAGSGMREDYDSFYLPAADTLQEGVELEVVESEGHLTFKVPADQLPRDNYGNLLPVYSVTYCLQVKNADALAALNSAATMSPGYTYVLSNVAKAGTFESAEEHIGYTAEVIDKTLSYGINQDKSENPLELNYTISVNPDKADLDPYSDKITFYDEYENISIDFSSIEVFVDGTLDEGDRVQWYARGNVVTFTAVDGHAITVTYKAAPIFTPEEIATMKNGGTVRDKALVNKAAINGFVADASEVVVYKASGEGFASNHGIRVMKYKDGEMTAPIDGVGFKLYDADDDRWLPTVQTTSGEFVTGMEDRAGTQREGFVTISGSTEKDGWEIDLGHQYYLMETSVPEDYPYKWDPSIKYYFTITEDGSIDYSTGVRVYADFDVLTVVNEKRSMEIPVSKIWIDETADKAVFDLYRNDETQPIGTITLTSDDADHNGVWQGEFKDLDVRDAEGNLIKYRVVEQGVDETLFDVSYKWNDESADPAASNYSPARVDKGITVTNTRIPTVDATVSKVWDDADNQDGIRPESVSVQLYADDEPYGDPVVLNEANGWSYTYENLRENDAQTGEPIAYTWSELSVPTGYEATQEINESGETVITNTHKAGVTSATLTKVWNDADNQDGIRPDTITVTLTGTVEGQKDPVSERQFTIGPDVDGVSVSADTWTYTVSDLPAKHGGKAISYAWSESEDSQIKGYTSAVSADGATITNTHEVEKVDLTVKKAWDDADNQDGYRPAALAVTLTGAAAARDGFEAYSHEYTVTLNAGNNWEAVVENLPVYDHGRQITYTWTEEDADDYSLADTEVSGDGLTTTLTNKHEVETVDVTVSKVWEDASNQDGIRPDTIKVTLTGTVEGQKDPVSAVQYTLGPNEEGVSVEGNTWTFAVSGLPAKHAGKAVSYAWSEDSQVAGYESAVSVDGLATTITNTHEVAKTTLTVNKVWDDAENQDGIRPESISVELRANNGTAYLLDGTEVADVVLSDDNSWSATVENLPVNKEGAPIEYSWVEATGGLPEGYSSVGNETDGTVTTITNTYAPGEVSASLKKIWDDANDQDGYRPEELTVYLLADGKRATDADGNEIAVKLNADNNWFDIVSGLPEKAAGEAIAYTWEEQLDDATKAQYPEASQERDAADETLTVITNKHNVDKTQVSLVKNWSDNSDQSGKRPETLKVTLIGTAGDAQVFKETYELSADNTSESNADEWAIAVEDLDAKSAGVDIDYAWSEEDVAGYILSGTTEVGAATVFTNTITSVKVSKVDATNGEELDGAHIQIIEVDEDGNETVVEEWDSEAGAPHEVEGLETGKDYVLRETVAPDGYTVTTDTTFSIGEDGTVTSTGNKTVDEDGNTVLLVEDELTKVKVSKVDATNGEELDGAHIQIIDSEGNVVDEWDSVAGAPHEVEGLTVGEVYTLHEVVAPEGYEIAADTQFSIDEQGNVGSTGTVTTGENGETILLVEDMPESAPLEPMGDGEWEDEETPSQPEDETEGGPLLPMGDGEWEDEELLTPQSDQEVDVEDNEVPDDAAPSEDKTIPREDKVLTPKTGDSVPVAALSLMSTAAAAVLALAYVRLRRREDD